MYVPVKTLHSAVTSTRLHTAVKVNNGSADLYPKLRILIKHLADFYPILRIVIIADTNRPLIF